MFFLQAFGDLAGCRSGEDAAIQPSAKSSHEIRSEGIFFALRALRREEWEALWGSGVSPRPTRYTWAGAKEGNGQNR